MSDDEHYSSDEWDASTRNLDGPPLDQSNATSAEISAKP